MKATTSKQLAKCPAASTQAQMARKVRKFGQHFGDFDPGKHRIMRRQDVQRASGLSRSTLYRLIAAGSFPSPIKLSENAVGWLDTEVAAWVSVRIEESRSGKAGAGTDGDAL